MGLVGTQGRRPTFHDLRHTFATYAISECMDVKTVSSILGHTSAAMTLNIYASADPSLKRRRRDHRRGHGAQALSAGDGELRLKAGATTESTRFGLERFV